MGNTGTKPQSSMSNGQMQTRGLSAGDWVRLKRLNGAKNYKSVNLDTSKDIIPPTQPQLPYGGAIHVYRVGGSSKIRRPASDWTAYKASQTADFPTPSGRLFPFIEPGTAQIMTRLCDCSNDILQTKVAGCIKCQYDPVETYSKTNYNYGIEEIVLDQTYFGSLTGTYVCPIPTDITGYVKVYKITFESSNSYRFDLICNGDSDIDLALSYPNTPITTEAIQTAMTEDYCDDGLDLSPYFTEHSFTGGNDTVYHYCNAGETYYILALTYEPGDFELIVSID